MILSRGRWTSSLTASPSSGIHPPRPWRRLDSPLLSPSEALLEVCCLDTASISPDRSADFAAPLASRFWNQSPEDYELKTHQQQLLYDDGASFHTGQMSLAPPSTIGKHGRSPLGSSTGDEDPMDIRDHECEFLATWAVGTCARHPLNSTRTSFLLTLADASTGYGDGGLGQRGGFPPGPADFPSSGSNQFCALCLVALRGQTRDVTSFLRLSTDRGIPASFPPSTTIIHQTPVSRPRLGRPSPVLRAPTSTFTQDLHRAEASGLPSSPTTRRRPPSLGKRPLAVDRRHYRTWRGCVSDVNVTRGEELLADLPACFMGIQFDQPGPPQNRYADPYSNRI